MDVNKVDHGKSTSNLKGWERQIMGIITTRPKEKYFDSFLN